MTILLTKCISESNETRCQTSARSMNINAVISKVKSLKDHTTHQNLDYWLNKFGGA